MNIWSGSNMVTKKRIKELEDSMKRLEKELEEMKERIDKRYLSEQTMRQQEPILPNDVMMEYLFGEQEWKNK